MKQLKDLRIVIADDHTFLLKGLNEYLIASGLNVIGMAHDGTQALQLIIDESPDLAILDVEMPYLSGFGVAEICKAKGMSTKIVVLSFHKETQFVTEAKSLGIAGYVLKEDSTNEILECIEAVANGGTYFSKQLRKAQDSVDGQGLVSELTPSERKILRLIAQNQSTKEIADTLFVSERTIEKHRSNIVSKLNLSGQSNSLTIWALENKTLLKSL